MKSEKLDRLTSLLADVEEAFVVAGLLVQAEVKMNDQLALRWAKHGSDWQLMLVLGDQDNRTPLLGASVRMRCASVSYLPDLRRAIDVAALERDKQIDAAIEGAEAFLASLQTSTESQEKP